jgi:cysteinyl-tRNA synthetase
MAKSLGNFVTIRDVYERYDPEALRYFLLGVHYRGPIGFDVPEGIARFAADVGTALDDDLNMPLALAALSELLKAVNELVEGTRRKKGTAPAPAIEAAKAAFATLGAELGVGLAEPRAFLRALRDKRAKARGITDQAVEDRIAARKAARDAKDFAKADALRDELVAMGVELMDGPTGTSWRIP